MKVERWSAPFFESERPQSKGKELEKSFSRRMSLVNKDPDKIAVRLGVERLYKNPKIHTGKQPCDYFVCTKNRTFFLDTKATTKDKFYPAQQAKHQRAAISKAQINGHKAGFIVWFAICDPAMCNLRFIESLSGPKTIEDGERFDWFTFFDEGV